VHEAGHFFTAKSFDIRVDEFGLGYPPRAKKLFRWKGTDFTLNWLPFGGFVKIFGESPDEEVETMKQTGSFSSKHRGIQASVLVSGVFANFLFAWLLVSVGFMIGLPAAVDSGLPVSNVHTVIVDVVPGSPAALAGFQAGDAVVSVGRGNIFSNTLPAQISNFISSSAQPVNFVVTRGKQTVTESATPLEGITPDRLAVGIELNSIGTTKLSLFSAVWHGLLSVVSDTWQIITGLGVFLKSIFVGHADFSQITGPVGIIGLVGSARALGFVYLLTFTALISLNLAVINLLPIPALDGGRLLFVGIEAIRRKPISAKIFNALNNASFVLLIILMVLVTIRDVMHLF
jgi:regulator of sigma E protease